jgi:hypothetical protein
VSWFRKKKADDDQEDMLRDIVHGGSPIVAPPQQATMAAAPVGLPTPEMNPSIAKAMQAIASHGDLLRARGIDPAQIQSLLQARLNGGTAAGEPIVITAGANPFAGFAAPGATADPHEDLVGALENLSRLHAAGSLSDDEFAAAKTKLLAAD